MGYLKKDLPGEDKQEMLGLMEDYRQEPVPLIVPLTLLLRRSATCGGMRCPIGCGTPGAGREVSAAGPKELVLRNHG